MKSYMELNYHQEWMFVKLDWGFYVGPVKEETQDPTFNPLTSVKMASKDQNRSIKPCSLFLPSVSVCFCVFVWPDVHNDKDKGDVIKWIIVFSES